MSLMRYHEEIVVAATASSNMDIGNNEADEALREVVEMLIDSKEGKEHEEASDNARMMAQFASDMLSVPRYISMIPALALGELAQSLNY